MTGEADDRRQASTRGAEPRFEQLRAEVLRANQALPAVGLVTLTWGNASQIDRADRVIAIKPSGVAYEAMKAEDIVVLGVDGRALDVGSRPSTDTPTHLVLYGAFADVGGIVHTHSPWATAWAQAEREIPLLGTTHADLSPHPIPLTRALTEQEVDEDYETATGMAIVEAVVGLGPRELPCVLVRQHGPFCWGRNAQEALEHAVTLEAIARLAALTHGLEPRAPLLDPALRRKHFERKHGPRAYYGQR